MNPTARLALASLLALLPPLVPSGLGGARGGVVETPVLFDCGTKDSPVADGAVRVTHEDAYSPRAGFGWTSKGQRSFDRDRPLPQLGTEGNPHRGDLLYRDHATPLTRDGVASEQDLQFRIDVKRGRYRVHVWVGDVHEPLQSMAVECNGQAVAKDVNAKHIIGRAVPESTGLYRLVQFTADASEGRIELRFYGDETRYREDRKRYEEWFEKNERVASYMGSPWDADRRLKFDPNGPFTRNSVLAIRVVPFEDPLFDWQGGKLVATREDSRPRDAFLSAFNRGDFAKAAEVIDSREAPSTLRVRGCLALLGHPLVEGKEEERWLTRSRQTVDKILKDSPGHVWALEARDSLESFAFARQRFHGRGMAEEGHFQENRKAVSMMRMVRPGDLLYYKALQYEGRALQMLDPHRWVYPGGDAQRAWKRLAETFPDNRYARFYLTDKWTPDRVWYHGDHLAGTKGAPEWAVAQREAFGLLLEMCEWWAANKQYADGSIGGGWGDDVELVALFGLMGCLSEGASEPSLRLATSLIDGLWKHGGIDREAGFYRGLLDAEHSAEWTGDTLPLMLTTDWGNPLWIERATQSARLMRDLWMDVNDRGVFHFRSNFLGSVGVGNEKQANDSYINFRAALPAVAVYRYNRNPEVGKLFVRWADAWVEAALRTDRGKPRGIFPAEVGYPKGELGGVDSPNWYTSAHPAGTVNYDWEEGGYYEYLVDLMLLAHEITGKDKYLKPFQLQKELVERYRANPEKSPKAGSEAWASKLLDTGSPHGRAPFDTIWKRISRAAAPGDAKPRVLATKDDVLRRMDARRRELKRRWPLLTTEASATDRVAFSGIADPYFTMTGTRSFEPSVTYAGVGRDFAAYVARADELRLEIVLYNFADKEVRAEIIPWKLEVGGTYLVRAGTVTNGDDKLDEKARREFVLLKQRGQRIAVPLPPRQTTRIEIEQTKAGRGANPLPDLAVVASEIKYSLWTRELQVTVHNVGTQAARKSPVVFYEETNAGKKKLGEVTIPHLSWAEDLEAKKITLAIPYLPTEAWVSIVVVVDEANRVEEICESNNRAIRRFAFDLKEVNAPRNRLGEIGGNLTGEIERGIR